jgi:trans-aconitate methyltransferase
MAPHEAWQVAGSAAELYQRYLVPTIASLWAADLIDRAAPRPRERVLDVACGTGVVARLAAERMSSGRVGRLDINADMLAVARSLPGHANVVSDGRNGRETLAAITSHLMTSLHIGSDTAELTYPQEANVLRVSR